MGVKELIHLVSRVGLDQVHHSRGWLRIVLSPLSPVGGAIAVSLSIWVLNRGKRGHGVADAMISAG